MCAPAESLEARRGEVFGVGWSDLVDECVLRGEKIRRSYDTSSLCDLLRLLRNRKNHFWFFLSSSLAFGRRLENRELAEEARVLLGGPSGSGIDSEGVYDYFETRFPNLLMVVHNVVRGLE